MPRIDWSSPGSRYFNAGLDRGVLYVGGRAVPWNGLVSVEEKPINGEIIPLYVDGVRVRNISNFSEYSSTLSAFYSPEEFDVCDGTVMTDYEGLYITNQPRQTFGLSYRTGVSNDHGRLDYKIHMVYNAMVEPSTWSYKTISGDPEPSLLQWDIQAVPNLNMGNLVSAHYIFDTTKSPSYIIEELENCLYGTNTQSPRLPTLSDIRKIFVKLWALKVEDTTQYSISGSDKAVANMGGYYDISSPDITDEYEYYTIVGE